MYRKSYSQRRYWTQVAQDIGTVLRKQIVDSRVKRASQSQWRHSANKLLKSLIDDATINKKPQMEIKKVYFMAPLKRLKTQKLPQEKKSTFQTLKSMKQFYEKPDSEQALAPELSPTRQMQSNKQKDAQLMRRHLHKLKIESNVRKIFDEKEKQYKVWKYRTLQKKKITFDIDSTML